MPTMNRGSSTSGELRRLTRRLHRALGGPPQPQPRRTGPLPRAAAASRGQGQGLRPGVKILPGVRVGPVGRLLVRILNHYPHRNALSITSGYRPGPRSHHRGLIYLGSPTAAIDIAAPGAAGMRDVAKWLYEHF